MQHSATLNKVSARNKQKLKCVCVYMCLSTVQFGDQGLVYVRILPWNWGLTRKSTLFFCLYSTSADFFPKKRALGRNSKDLGFSSNLSFFISFAKVF